MITLPLSTAPNGVQEAQKMLQEAIDDTEDTVIIVVYGPDSPDIQKVLAACNSQVIDDSRETVFCPDTAVLSTDQKSKFYRDGMVAASIGEPDATTAAQFLGMIDAQDTDKVAKAFLKAEAQ